MPEQVYFVKSGDLIKIGFTKRTVDIRFRRIDLPASNEKVVLATIPGSMVLEKAIHHYLADCRVHREWFQDCAEVRDLMNELLRRGADAEPFMMRCKFWKIARLMWPQNTIEQFARFAEQPDLKLAEAWLKDDKRMPRLIAFAFSFIVTKFMIGGGVDLVYDESDRITADRVQRAA